MGALRITRHRRGSGCTPRFSRRGESSSICPELKIGVSVYPHDFAFVIFFAGAGLLRLMWDCRPKSSHYFLLGLCVCFAYSGIRGIGDYGLQTAGNESRGTAYALAAAFYFMTFTYDDTIRRRLVNVFIARGCGLAGLAMLRRAALYCEYSSSSELGKCWRR